MSEARYTYVVVSMDPAQLTDEVLALDLPGYSHLLTSGRSAIVVCTTPLASAHEQRLETAVLAHRPDPDGPKKRVRDAAKALARATDPDSVRLRAALKVVLQAIGQDRQYMATLRAELQSMGRLVPPAPSVRTWEQLLAAFDAEVNSGDADA